MTTRALLFVLLKVISKRMDVKDVGAEVFMDSCKIRLSHRTIVKRLSRRVSQDIRVCSAMGNLSFLAFESIEGDLG